MAIILCRCQSCDHTMKFSADKAGKKTKCSKCGTALVIQEEDFELAAPEPEAAAPALAVAAAPEAAPAPEVKAAPVDPFADDGPANYGVYIDPELEALAKQRQEEEEAAKKKKKKEKKDLPGVARKIKAIPDALQWDVVRFGLLLWMFGACAWLAAHLLHGIYVLIGSVELPEYANLIAANLNVRAGDTFPERGRFWNVDEFNIYLGIIAGRDYAFLAKLCLTLATILYFVQAVAWGGGYMMCLAVPRNYGMFWHVLAMMGLLGFNTLVVLFFKLLPILGVYNYFMIPYVVPEIAMTEYNMERSIPINVLWSGAPFWENFLCIIFKFAHYLEPTIACIFIWSAGVAIKDKEVEESGKGMTEMVLGTFFVLFGFHLLSICGASPVLVRVLRVFFTLWFFFLVLFLLQYVLLLLKVRAVLDEKIRPKNELTQGDEKKDKGKDAKAKGAKKSKASALLGETTKPSVPPRAPGCRSP